MAAAKNTARLAIVAVVVLCLLLATAPQEAAGADEGQRYLTYDKLIKGAQATRPGKPANAYTRGCSQITQCRG